MRAIARAVFVESASGVCHLASALRQEMADLGASLLHQLLGRGEHPLVTEQQIVFRNTSSSNSAEVSSLNRAVLSDSSEDNISALVSELEFIRNIRSTIIDQLNEITGDLLEPIRTTFDNILAEPLNLSEGITNKQVIDLLRNLLNELSIEGNNLIEATGKAISTTFDVTLVFYLVKM